MVLVSLGSIFQILGVVLCARPGTFVSILRGARRRLARLYEKIPRRRRSAINATASGQFGLVATGNGQIARAEFPEEHLQQIQWLRSRTDLLQAEVEQLALRSATRDELAQFCTSVVANVDELRREVKELVRESSEKRIGLQGFGVAFIVIGTLLIWVHSI